MDEDRVGDAPSSVAASDTARHAALAAGVAASFGTRAAEGAEPADSSRSSTRVDPTLLAWQDWHKDHQLRERLWRERQRLDATAEEVDRDPRNDEDADGLDEKRAVVEDELLAALFATPAGTILGVIAKLDALLAVMEPGPDCEDEPWPQIRAVVADLCRLDRDAALRG
jgi:hypothetical protein